MKTNKNYTYAFISIMISYFVMGFIDLVGSASNYIKADFNLTDSIAGFFPTMVFFWFLVLPIPISLLMNRIGRQKTVMISLVITTLSLIIPLIHYSLITTLIAFALLGIGNTFLQVPINPLLSVIVNKDKLASRLTFGQFIKSICSFSAPVIATQAAVKLGDWRYMFAIYFVIGIISIIMMGTTRIKENDKKTDTSSFMDCIALLKNPIILILFLGIFCHVGLDVGTNMSAPKILIERLGLHIHDAIYITSIYFIFRILGNIIGTYMLSKFSVSAFFKINILVVFTAVIGLFIFTSLLNLYACVALIGFGNANIFSIILSQAMLRMPNKKNEVSGLMVMGTFGGAVLPLLMGITADLMGSQTGFLIILLLCTFYLLFVGFSNVKKV